MIEFKNTIVIKRPLPEVFAFISDFENMPKWNYYITEVNKLTNGPVGEGTTYHQTQKTVQQQLQVIEFNPNETFAIEKLPPERALQMRFHFDSVEGGTQIIDVWQLDVGVPGPFGWFAARKVKSAVSENLRKLKELLETGHVMLQDGREVQHEQQSKYTALNCWPTMKSNGVTFIRRNNMQFKDGAQVITAEEQKAGKLKRIVIEPETKEATHIVIQKGFLFTEDKVVPMSMVGAAAEDKDKVKLRADTDDLDNLPHFEESHYIATETTGQSTNQPSPGISSIYWYPPVASRWAADNPYNGGGRQTAFIKETSRNIPECTIALKEGASVISGDDQLIGKIEGVITSSPEERVSHLLVTQGLIWTEKKLVPVTWISGVDNETVTLSVSSEFVENLPEFQT